jgi:hypothetical protein
VLGYGVPNDQRLVESSADHIHASLEMGRIAFRLKLQCGVTLKRERFFAPVEKVALGVRQGPILGTL